jgi:cytidylate kinase
VPFVIVTGPSGSGKSTLAVKVAADLGWPLLTKDLIKESLADDLGLGDETWSHRLSDAALNLLFVVARVCPAAVIEGNFKIDEDSLRFASLVGTKVQLFCTAPTPVLIDRVTRRADNGERHPIHEDAMNPDEIAEDVRKQVATLGLLAVDGPAKTIDTSQDVDDAAIAAWIRSEL